MTRKNPASAIIALIRWWRTSPASRSITEFIYAVAGFFGCWRTGFPSGIYYRETKSETQVIAVLDLRRDPNWIRKELSWRD